MCVFGDKDLLQGDSGVAAWYTAILREVTTPSDDRASKERGV